MDENTTFEELKEGDQVILYFKPLEEYDWTDGCPTPQLDMDNIPYILQGSAQLSVWHVKLPFVCFLDGVDPVNLLREQLTRVDILAPAEETKADDGYPTGPGWWWARLSGELEWHPALVSKDGDWLHWNMHGRRMDMNTREWGGPCIRRTPGEELRAKAEQADEDEQESAEDPDTFDLYDVDGECAWSFFYNRNANTIEAGTGTIISQAYLTRLAMLLGIIGDEEIEITCIVIGVQEWSVFPVSFDRIVMWSEDAFVFASSAMEAFVRWALDRTGQPTEPKPSDDQPESESEAPKAETFDVNGKHMSASDVVEAINRDRLYIGENVVATLEVPSMHAETPAAVRGPQVHTLSAELFDRLVEVLKHYDRDEVSMQLVCEGGGKYRVLACSRVLPSIELMTIGATGDDKWCVETTTTITSQSVGAVADQSNLPPAVESRMGSRVPQHRIDEYVKRVRRASLSPDREYPLDIIDEVLVDYPEIVMDVGEYAYLRVRNTRPSRDVCWVSLEQHPTTVHLVAPQPNDVVCIYAEGSFLRDALIKRIEEVLSEGPPPPPSAPRDPRVIDGRRVVPMSAASETSMFARERSWVVSGEDVVGDGERATGIGMAPLTVIEQVVQRVSKPGLTLLVKKLSGDTENERTLLLDNGRPTYRYVGRVKTTGGGYPAKLLLDGDYWTASTAEEWEETCEPHLAAVIEWYAPPEKESTEGESHRMARVCVRLGHYLDGTPGYVAYGFGRNGEHAGEDDVRYSEVLFCDELSQGETRDVWATVNLPEDDGDHEG